MPSIRDYFDPGGRMLARRLDQLCSTIESLSARLRTTIANAIGETIGGFVRDSALRVLDELAQYLPDAAPPPSARSLRDTLVKLAGEDYQPDGAGFWADERESDRTEPAADDDTIPSTPERLPTALSTGLQAAAWCLRRWSGQGRMLTTFAVGLVAAGIAYIGGPLAAAVLSLAGSATQFGGVDGLGMSDATPNYYDP
jgi:hypothetical protein